ncbi:MAG: hypothetical protein AAFQ22_07640 [Pseudomonadota bacterium]
MAENTLQGEWTVSRRHALVRERAEVDLRLVGLLFALAIIAAVIRPPYAFSIDEMIYVEMARAFWQTGVLFISERGGVSGAPELVLTLTHGIDGKVYPEFPALYGIIAAPFYGLAGVRGLVFLNAISFFAVLWLTLRIVRHLYGLALDRRFVAGLLALATFTPAYGMGIWPHMFALALVLAGVERATAHLADRQAPDRVRLILAGLWLGCAIAIRSDSALPAIALVYWMALFGAPGQRMAPLWLIFGMAPFLVLSSALNGEKFGTYFPISHGPDDGWTQLGPYTLHLTALLGALATAIWINPEEGRCKAWLARLRTPYYAIPALMIAASVVLLAAPTRSFAWNTFVLVTNLQWIAPEQIEHAAKTDAAGLVHILGIYKRALIQSAPWLVLAGVAVGGFAFGQRTAARGLCILMTCTVIGFYGLQNEQGGYGHNMRLFLPALPFLAILSVDGFTSLCRGVGARQRRTGLVLGGIIGSCIIAVAWLGLVPPGSVFLYIPLAVAAALLALSLAVSAGRRQQWLKRGWLLVTGAAVAMGCLATLSDIAGQHSRAAYFAPITKTAAASLPKGSLLVTSIEEHFLLTPPAGAYLVSPKRLEGRVARAAIAAFRAEGRCVYVHTVETAEALVLSGDWAPLQLPGLQGPAATLVEPAFQSTRCKLNPSA